MRTPAKETPLGKALRMHKESCLHCQEDAARPKFSQALSCPDYIAIVNQATDQRRIYEGPMHGHSWLSVREAVNV